MKDVDETGSGFGGSSPTEAAGLPTVRFKGYFPVYEDMLRVFALSSSILPMISAFLLAINHKFAFNKRWAMLTVAAERVCSEIYLYRARVGEYAPKSKHAKLAAIVGESDDDEPAEDPTQSLAVSAQGTNDSDTHTASAAIDNTPRQQTAKTAKKAPKKSKPPSKAKSSREVFHDHLRAVQTELMSSEVKMSALSKPSREESELLLESQLYPFVKEPTCCSSVIAWISKCMSSNGSDKDGEAPHPKRTLLEAGMSDFSLMAGDAGADDGICLITADDYMRFRLLPNVTRLNKNLPRHEKCVCGLAAPPPAHRDRAFSRRGRHQREASHPASTIRRRRKHSSANCAVRVDKCLPILPRRWFNASQTVILLATMLASVSGVLGLYMWIPAITAIVAAVDSLQNFDQTSARLLGTNSALTQLKNLRIWYAYPSSAWDYTNTRTSQVAIISPGARF